MQWHEGKRSPQQSPPILGIEVAKNVMGHDIFDTEYSGYAIMTDFAWLSEETYVKEGSVIEMGDMSEEEIRDMDY